MPGVPGVPRVPGVPAATAGVRLRGRRRRRWSLVVRRSSCRGRRATERWGGALRRARWAVARAGVWFVPRGSARVALVPRSCRARNARGIWSGRAAACGWGGRAGRIALEFGRGRHGGLQNPTVGAVVVEDPGARGRSGCRWSACASEGARGALGKGRAAGRARNAREIWSGRAAACGCGGRAGRITLKFGRGRRGRAAEPDRGGCSSGISGCQGPRRGGMVGMCSGGAGEAGVPRAGGVGYRRWVGSRHRACGANRSGAEYSDDHA